MAVWRDDVRWMAEGISGKGRNELICEKDRQLVVIVGMNGRIEVR